MHGRTIDDQTRCVHYGTAQDVVAIKFACCRKYYPCHRCHEESEDHPARQWPVYERQQKAILCGVCSTELTIARYLNVQRSSAQRCPNCDAEFNAGCRLHSHLYFQPE